MIDLDIPDFGKIELTHLVCDYNGTLAIDGQLIPSVSDLLVEIARHIEIHVLTADTFGVASQSLCDLPVKLTVLPALSQMEAKRDFISRLGARNVVAIGNGRNDRLMLESAGLSIAVVQREGCATETLRAASITAVSITHALELLLNPKRLIATLRS